MENINEIRKRESIEVGYVNFGYFSPELSSTDEYPDYIKAEAQRCIAEIKSHKTDDSVTFGFMTDIHYSDTPNHNVRTKRLTNAYKEISNAVGADMLILGGDYVNDGKKAYKLNNYKMLAEHLKGIKYYPVNGNHDDNSIWDLYTENEVSENHISAKEIYNCLYAGLADRGAEFNETAFGLYYMYNDNKAKIRYIFLDTSDIPEKYDEKGKLKYTKQHTFGMQDEQKEWFINKVLRFNESGWRVIITAHSVKEQHLEFICDTADAFNSRERIEKSYPQEDYKLNVCADFSNANAEIICFLCGHEHADFTEYTKGGIPCIYFGNVIMYKTALPRIDGEKSELLFDFITVTEDEIYLTRVGAGEDRTVKIK